MYVFLYYMINFNDCFRELKKNRRNVCFQNLDVSAILCT